MNRAEFIAEIATTLESTEPLTGETVLADIPDYDSLAILNLLSLYDGLNVTTNPEEISKAETVDDLVAIAGSALSDG
ncbi:MULTISPECIES: hypothetical protein [unclassified Sphingomonas]|uniref:hypothetical protein n=1 Tax=unclassified Sphingomonas TaxID=196159 RepID=UPI0006F2AF93|nr:MULTISPECIES: hypothetical protein [unclassified Sphingomonas]KQM98963.1 hypothetical protein ASE77_17280 [Sphingomonas sp. Leaf226]MDY0968991.1 hypothetical protein [Sphingomonas sp. CFBP9021]